MISAADRITDLICRPIFKDSVPVSSSTPVPRMTPPKQANLGHLHHGDVRLSYAGPVLVPQTDYASPGPWRRRLSAGISVKDSFLALASRLAILSTPSPRQKDGWSVQTPLELQQQQMATFLKSSKSIRKLCHIHIPKRTKTNCSQS